MNDEFSSAQRPNDPEQEGTNPQDKHTLYGEARNTDTRKLVNEYRDPDDDSVRDILDQIRINALYPEQGGLAEERAPLRERIKKGAKLAVQQMEYVRLMEDRMKDMEQRLSLIEKKGIDPEPSSPPPEVTNQPAESILGIKRMTFQEYLPINPNKGNKDTTQLKHVQHMYRHELPRQLPCHLIDVVVSGMKQPERLGNDHITKSAEPSFEITALGPDVPDRNLAVHDLPSVQPERIRINSTLLLNALKTITQTEFYPVIINNSSKMLDQVFLRPFKLFVTYEQEIRDEIDRLEEMYMRDSNESTPDAPKTTKNESQNTSNPPTTDANISLDVANHSSRNHSDSLTDDKSQNATVVDSSIEEVQEEL